MGNLIGIIMRLKNAISLLVGCLLSTAVSATDLMDVYMEAQANDPQYASARAANAAAQEKKTQGLSKLLPNINANGGYARNYPGDTQYSENQYGITLTQPLFNIAAYQNWERSKLETELGDAQFAEAKQDVMIRVADAYFAVLTAQEVLAFSEIQKEAVSQQLALARRNFEVGNATITDTHEAVARYNLAEADEIAAVNELEVRKTALEEIIGHPPGILDPLREHVLLKMPEPAIITDWVDMAGNSNYRVVESQLAYEIAKRQTAIAKAGHAPTVDLVASYNHTNHDQYTMDSRRGLESFNSSKMVGIQWNIPLFSGFETSSKVKESVSLEEKSRNDLEAAKRSATQQARQYFLSVSSGLSQVRALESAETASLTALESNKLGYEVGVRINIDVLNAEQQLYDTRKNLTRARNETILYGLRLKRAAGTLVEDDLQEVNLLLQK